MISKLRIDLNHKTERLQFSGTPRLSYLTIIQSYLSFWAKKRSSLKQTRYLYESKLELSKLAKYELYTQREIW